MNPTSITLEALKPASQSASAGDHLIGSIRGSLPGPTLLILGGIHGNEPAGVLAAARVLPRIKERRAALRGEVVFLRGNTRALQRKVRYIDADLNRQWPVDNAITMGFEAGQLVTRESMVHAAVDHHAFTRLANVFGDQIGHEFVVTNLAGQ
jgi:succinylglutamate desuccinylase